MMTAEQLLGSIFERALQGKLVEQRVSEGTGEDLFQKIQAEKQRLIKSGELKKPKPVEPITEDEIPFDIPETWKWVRVESIVTLNPKNELADDTETAFIPMTLVADGYSNHHTFEVRKWGEIKKGFSHFADGDIGVAKITPCFQNRKSVIFKKLINGFGAGTTELTIVRPFTDSCCPEYLLAVFKSESFIKKGMKSFTGTAGQQRIHKDFLRTYVMPLPPLEEQKRIVAKLEELMQFVEQYAQASTRLNTLNASFPDQMKKSILQQAVMGKLMPQDPNDEPASVLLKKIVEEKLKLIKEGKIKKEQELDQISEDEIPFDIPENWKWARLGSLITVRGGKRLPAGKQLVTEKTDHIYIRVTDMKNETVDMSDLHYLTDDIYEGIKSYIIRKEDIFIVIVGSTIGKAGIIPDELDGMNLTENAARLTPYYVDKEFLLKMITSDFMQSQFIDKTHQVGQPKLALFRLKDSLIPVPPLNEQKRIVQKLKELSPQIDVLRTETK